MKQELERYTVSVVIPTYNCATFLSKAIHSAYSQSRPALEVVVVNDGSTDGTLELLERLRSTLPANFVFDSQPNGGEAAARNRGVALARGQYIAFLDADDAWLPDKLERQMQLFERDPALALTFTAYHRISTAGGSELICLPDWQPTTECALQHLVEGCCITPSTVVVRRDALLEVGDFKSLPMGVDWEMWLRLTVAGHRMEYLPQPLTEYYWHGANMSSDLRKVGQAAQDILSFYFGLGKFPPAIQRLERRCIARWRMIHACYCLEAGDNRQARRYLWEAAKTRPASIRPGWSLLFLRSLFG